MISDSSSDPALVDKAQKVLEHLQSLPSPHKKDALLINMGIGKAVVVADGGRSFSLELKEQLGERKLIVSRLGEQAGQDASDNAFLGEVLDGQDTVMSSTAENTPGGIDLTRRRLPLETRGEGVEFDLPFDPNHLEKIPLNGLTPVIFQITPVTNLPLLSGLAEDPSKQLSAVR